MKFSSEFINHTFSGAVLLTISYFIFYPSVGNANPSVIATSEPLAPTPKNAIAQAITGDVQELSDNIVQVLDTLRNARASLEQCDMSLQTGVPDSTTYATNTECLVEGYAKTKQSYQLAVYGFTKFGKDLEEKYKALGIARQVQKKALEEVQLKQRKHQSAINKTEQRIKKIAQHAKKNDLILEPKVRLEAMKLFAEYEQLSLRKRIIDNTSLKLANIDKLYQTSMKNVAAWKDKTDLQAYRISLQTGTLDLLLDNAQVLGAGQAGIADWDGAGPALTILGDVWREFGPTMDTINKLAGAGFPLPTNSQAFASPPTDVDDESLIEWLNNFIDPKE